MEAMVKQSCDFVGTPQLNFEECAALVRSSCRGEHQVSDPNAFAAWMCRRSVYGIAAATFKVQCGLAAADPAGNAYRFERTRRDIRLADTDWYLALFPQHAADLLERRRSLGTGQHLSEIAYACGFRVYAHFARRFRNRFGHSPGAHLEGRSAMGNRIVPACAAEHSPSAHKVLAPQAALP
jgi:AraC-like DNA-binding protein